MILNYLKTFAYCCVFFTLHSTYGQSSFPIKSAEASFEQNEDFAAFDSIFSGKKIICVGESTHGTHEFFTMRHRLFKYLVENHQFNTFYLEADYGACLRLNRYIHGEQDSLNLVVKAIKLWPWITTEMEDMVEWMRIYNSKNENKISFVGCDVQFFAEAIEEIDRLILKNNPALLDTSIKLCVPNYYKSRITKDSILVREIIAHKKEIIPALQMSNSDLNLYNTLVKNLEQIVITKESEKYYTRDLFMGQNMLNYLARNSDDKIFYWAHNHHIFNNFSTHRKNETDTLSLSAGSVVKRQLKHACLLILQDFSEGSFNALVLTNPDSTKFRDKYSMEENTVNFKKENLLLANNVDFTATSIALVENNYFESVKKPHIHGIGALFTANTKFGYTYYYKQDFCDWLILHKDTTPTHFQ